MSRIILAIAAIAAMLAGCTQNISVDLDSHLTGIPKDEKLPHLAKPGETVIPFVVNDKWAAELSKFVPIFGKPEFQTESQLGKPQIFRSKLSSKTTDILATTYHKADPRDVFDWLDKNYSKFGLALAKIEERDSRVYIVGDEHGYLILRDGELDMEIHVWKMSAYPGWCKVTYQGTSSRDCGCETK